MADARFFSRDCWTVGGFPKKRYRHRRDAKRAARRVGKRNEAYECPQCGWFHTGRKPST